MNPLVLSLVSQGMSLLGNAVAVKGKEWLKQKTAIDLDTITNQDALKLKQFEMDNEEELLKLAIEQKHIDLEETKLHLDDTADARDMQKEAIRQDDKFTKRFVLYFAAFWSILAAGFFYSITFIQIPESNIRFADTILGFLLGSIVSQIMQFFYGSSKSSQDKDSTIRSAIQRSSR